MVLEGDNNSVDDSNNIVDVRFKGDNNTFTYGSSKPKIIDEGDNNKVIPFEKPVVADVPVTTVAKKPTSTNKGTGTVARKKTGAPHFTPLPGPQVELTGKYF